MEEATHRVVVSCPACGVGLRLPAEQRGLVHCPNCNAKVHAATHRRVLPAILISLGFGVIWTFAAALSAGGWYSVPAVCVASFAGWKGLKALCAHKAEAPISVELLGASAKLFKILALVTIPLLILQTIIVAASGSFLAKMSIVKLQQLRETLEVWRIASNLDLFIKLTAVGYTLLAVFLITRGSAARAKAAIATQKRITRLMTVGVVLVKCILSFAVVSIGANATFSWVERKATQEAINTEDAVIPLRLGYIVKASESVSQEIYNADEERPLNKGREPPDVAQAIVISCRQESWQHCPFTNIILTVLSREAGREQIFPNRGLAPPPLKDVRSGPPELSNSRDQLEKAVEQSLGEAGDWRRRPDLLNEMPTATPAAVTAAEQALCGSNGCKLSNTSDLIKLMAELLFVLAPSEPEFLPASFPEYLNEFVDSVLKEPFKDKAKEWVERRLIALVARCRTASSCRAETSIPVDLNDGESVQKAKANLVAFVSRQAIAEQGYDDAQRAADNYREAKAREERATTETERLNASKLTAAAAAELEMHGMSASTLDVQMAKEARDERLKESYKTTRSFEERLLIRRELTRSIGAGPTWRFIRSVEGRSSKWKSEEPKADHPIIKVP
jgi:hypothetical protein